MCRLVILGVLALIFGAGFDAVAQPFWPPGVLNWGGTTDSGADQFVSHLIDSNNTYHAVWASQDNYTGDAGTDADIYYSVSAGSGWSKPILVNSYGKYDTGNDEAPKLVQGPDGTLHCIWRGASNYAGTGTDGDIFYSQKKVGNSSWSAAEVVNSYATSDNYTVKGEDSGPGLIVRKDGSVVAAWASVYDLTTGTGKTGTEGDIMYSIRVGGVWTTARPLNGNATTDTGKDWGPVAMGIVADGSVAAAWSSDEPKIAGKGSDRDIVISILVPGGSWTTPGIVAYSSKTDMGADTDPAIATFGQEVQIVWSSNDPMLGKGTDTDILAATIIITGPLGKYQCREAGLINSDAKTDGAADEDLYPTICYEPGGIAHCAWVSTGGATGSDQDIHHSANAVYFGNAWSPVDLLNLNGWFDTAGCNDWLPDIKCTPKDVISCAWQSNDSLFGTKGTDWDILHALGFGRGVTRPQYINQWGAPDTVYDSDVSPSFAFAPDGVLHAVWASNYNGIGAPAHGTDLDIFHATLGAYGWSAPDLVNGNGTNDSQSDLDPELAIDDSGRLHVVWASQANIGGLTGDDMDVFYTTNSGAGWTAPELVNKTGLTDPPDMCDYWPHVAVYGSKVHVVWTTTPKPATAANGDISYAQRSASGWGAVETIDKAYAAMHSTEKNPSLALDRFGVPHVAWQSDANYNGAGIDRDIHYSNRSSGSWSNPKFVNHYATSDGAYDELPTLAFTPDGVLHCVWASWIDLQGSGNDEDLFHASYSGGAWSQAQPLLSDMTSDNGYDMSPYMVGDKAGGLHVVWRSVDTAVISAGTDGDIRYVNIRPPLKFPSSAVPILANATGYADSITDYDPRVVVDKYGRAHFTWYTQETLGGTSAGDYDVLYSRTLSGADYLNAARQWEWYE
ncbi:glycoside hydrolase [bacterium]|nr:glycoside hydrolase [bacterium]